MTQKNKIAIVTGAAGGLGSEIAMCLGQNNCKVILVDVNEQGLAEMLERGNENKLDFESSCIDVSKENEIITLAKDVGPCNILVNGAGINIRFPVEEVTTEDWQKVMDINLTAAFLFSRELIPNMKASGFGRIINISSIAWFCPPPNRIAYSTTKAGLLGMTKALAVELAEYNITANVITPGFFDTAINKPLIENKELMQTMLNHIPVKRLGHPQEIAHLIRYICSEEAAYMTGAEIRIDGGLCSGIAYL